jgi:flagellar M-ring protein FliF
MAELNHIVDQSKAFVSGLSNKQRLMLLGGAVLTAAVLALFVHMIATPDYKPLMTGMEPADAQALASRLAAKNIPYQLGADGKSVSVPADKLDSSRMEVVSEGMPHSGRLGFELFDKLNWGQTEFDEKVNYQRALEGELERTIQTLRDVESARVHLVMPRESVFLDREQAAKASVILRLRSGRLSDDTQRSIAGLVSGAVDKLSPENVTVIDADTNRPLLSRKHGFSGSDAGLEEQLSDRLVSTLEPVVGAQRIRASVNVEYDPSTSEENQETYDPKSQVALTTQRSEEQIDGGAVGGVPGTASNVPGANVGAKTAVQPGDMTQTSKTESDTFAVDKLMRHTLQPPGRIRRISAALVVDDAVEVQQQNGKAVELRRKRTGEELKQIEQLAQAAIGLDQKRGDTLAVQNLSFQQPSEKAPEPPTRYERLRITLNDWSSIVRYSLMVLLFLLVYVFMLRPIKKHAVAAFHQLPDRLVEQQKAQFASRELEGLPVEALALPEAQRRALRLQAQLAEKAKSEPALTGRLVQTWLREEGQ